MSTPGADMAIPGAWWRVQIRESEPLLLGWPGSADTMCWHRYLIRGGVDGSCPDSNHWGPIAVDAAWSDQSIIPQSHYVRWAPPISSNGRFEDIVSDYLSEYPRVLSEQLLLLKCATSYLVYLSTRTASLAASWRNSLQRHSSRWWSSTIKIAIFR
jgi:hypothetical protein